MNYALPLTFVDLNSSYVSPAYFIVIVIVFPSSEITPLEFGTGTPPEYQLIADINFVFFSYYYIFFTNFVRRKCLSHDVTTSILFMYPHGLKNSIFLLLAALLLF